MPESEPRGEFETVYCSNGWIEIRNTERSNVQWIATDTPVEVER